MSHRLIFGMFKDGQLLLPLGQVVSLSLAQAEIIACILDISLPDGSYLAYDLAETWSM